MKQDKIMHVLAGAAIAALLVGYGASIWLGFVLSVVIGIAKELVDFTGNGTVEFNDFLATALGASTVLPMYFL